MNPHTHADPTAVNYECHECRRIARAERAAELAATQPAELDLTGWAQPDLFGAA